MNPNDPLDLKKIFDALILDQKLTLTPREMSALIQVVNVAQAKLEESVKE